MPLRPETVVVPKGTDSPEDPLALFPSEVQNVTGEIPNVPSEIQKVTSERPNAGAARPARASHIASRRFPVLTIASVVRMFRVAMAMSSRVARLAAAWWVLTMSALRRLRPSTFRLPDLRLPGWHLRAWHLPTWLLAAWRTRVALTDLVARLFVPEVAARTRISAIALAVFACGFISGAFVVWLSGVSRSPGVTTSTSHQTPLRISGAETLRVASVGTGSAVPPVHQAESHTTTATRSRGNRTLFRGSLVVNSRPSGARVFLNGRSVGETPLVLKNQPAGSRAVRVALDGYEPWSSAVQVVADTETRLRAELKIQRPDAQP